ncbi:MAG: ABC transporter ATP-binding protein [Bacteroidales bacterium]
MKDKRKTYLETENLGIGYRNNKLIRNMNLIAGSAEVIGLLGPNGAGKSTLLKSLMGLLPVLEGDIRILGKNPSALSARKKARLVSYVAASESLPTNLHVYELVAFGRYPYTGLMSKPGADDIQRQKLAMQQMQVSHLAARQLGEISDGEKQRAMIARALAQDTPLIILDEPAAHLDIKNRYELMRLLRRQAATTGKCIILSSHDLEIAMNYTDKLWMIDQGEIVSGLPEDLVLQGDIDKLVPSDEIRFDRKAGKFILPVQKIREVCVHGNGTVFQWTCHALRRYGFEISCNKSADIYVIIKENEGQPLWELIYHDDVKSCNSLEKLIVTIKNIHL